MTKRRPTQETMPLVEAPELGKELEQEIDDESKRKQDAKPKRLERRG